MHKKKEEIILSEALFTDYEDSECCFGSHYDGTLDDCKNCDDSANCRALSSGEAIGVRESSATVEEVFYGEKPSYIYDEVSFLALNRPYILEYDLDVNALKTRKKIQSKDGETLFTLVDKHIIFNLLSYEDYANVLSSVYNGDFSVFISNFSDKLGSPALCYGSIDPSLDWPKLIDTYYMYWTTGGPTSVVDTTSQIDIVANVEGDSKTEYPKELKDFISFLAKEVADILKV